VEDASRDGLALTPCTPDARRFVHMDGIAVKLERLKREAQRNGKRKWRKKVRQAAPANAAEWRALGGAILGGVLKLALIIALPFAVWCVARCSSTSTAAHRCGCPFSPQPF